MEELQSNRLKCKGILRVEFEINSHSILQPIKLFIHKKFQNCNIDINIIGNRNVEEVQNKYYISIGPV